jgi:hypothetical protein
VPGRRVIVFPACRAFVLVAATAIASASLPARGDVLRADERWINVGASIGAGYAAVTTADGTDDVLVMQAGVRAILWSYWEAALDLRVDVHPIVRDPADIVDTWSALLWLIANLDLLPFTPFIGLGGGAVFDGRDPAAVAPTFGWCLGVALWFEATWRLSLRGAQRWVFDDGSSASGGGDALSGRWMPTEIVLTGEWFF